MMLPSHLVVPVGGHRAGSADGASDSRVTATGGGLVEVVPAVASASAKASACPAAGLLIRLVGRVRVTEALALDSVFLVLTTSDPRERPPPWSLLPLWTTMTPIDPREVAWDPALVELIEADPVMATPVARPVVLTSTSRESEAPAARFPIEQVTLPDPADEQLVPDAAIAGQVIGERGPVRRSRSPWPTGR